MGSGPPLTINSPEIKFYSMRSPAIRPDFLVYSLGDFLDFWIPGTSLEQDFDVLEQQLQC